MREARRKRGRNWLCLGLNIGLCGTLCAVATARAAEAPQTSTPLPATQTRVQSNFSLSLPLLFDGAYQGDIPVSVGTNGKVSVDVERFVALLGRRLSPAMIAKIRAAANGQSLLPLDRLADAGVIASYDPATLELRVSVPIDKQGSQDLTAYERPNNGEPPPLTIAPEIFSASATFTARQTYDWGNGNTASDLGPVRVSADLAANFGGQEGVYAFAQGDFDGAGRNVTRGNIVLIHDDLKRAIRYSAGDVAPTPAGFQNSPTIGGLSIERQYGQLQPFKNIRPSGQFSFLLERRSTIDVVVNGSTLRTMQLDPGQYNLRDFPFFNGLNQIELYVVDSFGRRLLASFSQYFSARLLNKGVFEFGATGGILERTGTTGKRYLGERPSFSGYARYGMSDALTVGGNLQFTTNQWMAGAELGWASPLGTIGVLAATSHYDGLGSGHSLLASYEVSARAFGFLERPQLNLEFQETSRNFTPLAVILPVNRFKYELRSRFSTQLPADFGFGVSASYARGRDLQASETRYAANLSRRIGFINITASYERVKSRGPSDASRFLLTLNMPLGRSQNVRASYDSNNNQFAVEYSKFQRDEVDTLGVRAMVVRADNGVTGTGEVSYNANRFGILLQHSLITDGFLDRVRQQQTSYTIATQIAIAGDTVALGRPVGPRFAIVSAHPTLESASVGVMQGIGRDKAQARTDWLGPALAPAGNAYTPTQLRVDVDKLPTGYDIGPGQYDVFPGAASGYALTVGSDASRVVLGTVLRADGKPVALQGGEIRALDDPAFKPVLVFTNSAGRFVASGLAPGRYQMVLGANGELVVPITVPKESKGLVDAGTIRMGQ